jgi:hypothetical protein
MLLSAKDIVPTASTRCRECVEKGEGTGTGGGMSVTGEATRGTGGMR